jgi:hypothetical protein
VLRPVLVLPLVPVRQPVEVVEVLLCHQVRHLVLPVAVFRHLVL